MNPFAEIKDALPAEVVLEHFLGPSRGAWHCCFHEDHTPSLSAYGPAIRCFGCGWAGDLFNFLEDYHSVGRGEALRIAADLAGVRLPTRSRRAESLIPVRREIRIIEREILRMATMSAADAWRRAWTERKRTRMWQMVAIGAALDRHVEMMKMGRSDA